MTSSPAGPLLVGLILFGSAGLAVAGNAPLSALAKLKQAGEVSCEPSLPFFCSNIHVSCSGRTAIPALPFKLTANRTTGSVSPAPDADDLRKPYDNGPVEWDEEGTYVIVRPRLTIGYVKLLADGTYSFRHYPQHLGVMSYGRCQ